MVNDNVTTKNIEYDKKNHLYLRSALFTAAAG